MKAIKKGIAQTIALDQTGIGSGKTIYLTVIGDDGSVIKGSDNADIKDKSLTFNTTTLLYEITLTILEATPEQYIRLYIYSSNTSISSNYYPEDARLEATPDKITKPAEVVPVQYFIDYIIASKSKMDPGYEQAITNYMNVTGKDAFRSMLISAQDELEKNLEIYITERTLTERKDNYFERFNLHMWQIQVFYPPINALTSVKIMYGVNPIANVGLDLFTYERELGIIEFLPLPGGDSSGLYTLLIQNISGMGLALISGGLLDRIPNMFHITYKSGLWYSGTDPVEKEGLRLAVSRRALMNLMPLIDPASRKASVSESIDGVAGSESYQIAKLREDLKKDEEQYVLKTQRKYGKGLNAVIV